MFIRGYPGINAVKVGRLFLKPGDVYETITQSCRMVFHEASDRSLPLGRAGSATLVRYAGVNYVITTRHQLDIPRGASVPIDILDTIRIGSGKGRLSNIPLKRCIFELSNVEEEYHDILLFEAADTWKTQHSDQPFFYPLAPFSKVDRVKSFLVGYPTIEGVMDEYLEDFVPEQPGSIHIKRAISDCDLDTSYKTNVEFYRRYLHVRERPIVDGYSGGAVFSLTGELENLEVVLDGIVVRAGPQHIHVVDADYLLKIITDQSRRD